MTKYYTLAMLDGSWWGIFRTETPFRSADKLDIMNDFQQAEWYRWNEDGESKHPLNYTTSDAILLEDATPQQISELLTWSPTWKELRRRFLNNKEATK
jgi:hypothetical protein